MTGLLKDSQIRHESVMSDWDQANTSTQFMLLVLSIETINHKTLRLVV